MTDGICTVNDKLKVLRSAKDLTYVQFTAVSETGGVDGSLVSETNNIRYQLDVFTPAEAEFAFTQERFQHWAGRGAPPFPHPHVIVTRGEPMSVELLHAIVTDWCRNVLERKDVRFA